MKKGSRILAILVGMALTCSCGSPKSSPKTVPEQQPAGAPSKAPTPPAKVQPPTPPATVQPPPTPPTAAQPPTPPAKVQPPTPPTTVPPPPTPPTATQPPTPPAKVQPPTPPASVQPPPTPPTAAQPPTPPSKVLLKGNPTGAVKYPHAKHAGLANVKCDLCHHASKPEKPLGSKYQKCQECHTTVAVAPMKTKAQAAFHDPTAKKGLCVDCHLKRVAAGKKAPVTCPACHKKENV